MVIPLYTGSTPLPYMVCGDPESGTDYSLLEVSAYIIWYRIHTLGLQGKCHKLFSVLFYVHLQIICLHVSLKNSSAEGTCTSLKKGKKACSFASSSMVIFFIT